MASNRACSRSNRACSRSVAGEASVQGFGLEEAFGCLLLMWLESEGRALSSNN